jgi:hypothetical protein
VRDYYSPGHRCGLVARGGPVAHSLRVGQAGPCYNKSLPPARRCLNFCQWMLYPSVLSFLDSKVAEKLLQERTTLSKDGEAKFLSCFCSPLGICRPK